MITVGVPTYNRAGHLKHALAGILEQTYSDFELIVCDDGSTDDTPDVVRSLRDDRISYVRSTSNLKIPGVLNRILDLASGDAIVMLHDHDRFAVDLLAGMVELLAENPKVGFVNPGVAWEDGDGGHYEVMPRPLSPAIAGSTLVEQMLLGPSFACPITACALVRRRAYQAVGFGYDEEFGFLADVDLWLRLAMRFDVGQVDRVGLVCKRRDDGHEFANADWQLGRLIVAIHEANVERYFQGRPNELAQARQRVRQKALRSYGMMLASAAMSGEQAQFHAGLDLVAETIPGVPRLAANFLRRTPRLETAVVSAGSRAGATRRRLRGEKRA
jgi:glycosyltransferase involved in cell wall biosynthesis